MKTRRVMMHARVHFRLFVTCSAVLAGCLPSPTKEDLNGARHVDHYVIEIVAQDEGGRAITSKMSVDVRLSIQVAETDKTQAEPLNGIYYVVLPPRVERGMIESLTILVEGRAPVEVSFQTHPRQSYTPASRTVSGSGERCENQSPVPDEESGVAPQFIEFALRLLQGGFEDTAYASSYTYSCALTYRERDKITVTVP